MPNFRKLFSKKDTSQLFTQGAGFVLYRARHSNNGYLFIMTTKSKAKPLRKMIVPSVTKREAAAHEAKVRRLMRQSNVFG